MNDQDDKSYKGVALRWRRSCRQLSGRLPPESTREQAIRGRSGPQYWTDCANRGLPFSGGVRERGCAALL